MSTSGAGRAEPCEKCKKDIDESLESSIECEVCHLWFHNSCVDVPESLLDLLGTKGLHWFCSKCDGQASGLQQNVICEKLSGLTLELQKTVDKAKAQFSEVCRNQDVFKTTLAEVTETLETNRNKFNEMNNQHQTLEKSYADVAKALEQNSLRVQESFARQAGSLVAQLEDKEKQDRDSEFRAKNLILFGIEESDNREEWAQQVDKIIKDCHIDMKVEKNNSYRLGRYDASKHKERPRPLRISTRSENQMFELLSRINGMKLSGIFARKDLSKKEQEEDFRLRKELRETREADPDSAYKIKKGKIIKVNK